jgi:hypothetical protein
MKNLMNSTEIKTLHVQTPCPDKTDSHKGQIYAACHTLMLWARETLIFVRKYRAHVTGDPMAPALSPSRPVRHDQQNTVTDYIEQIHFSRPLSPIYLLSETSQNPSAAW